jgi:hypothetical protein
MKESLMAYIFHERDLPALISEVPGRERIFFVRSWKKGRHAGGRDAL